MRDLKIIFIVNIKIDFGAKTPAGSSLSLNTGGGEENGDAVKGWRWVLPCS